MTCLKYSMLIILLAGHIFPLAAQESPKTDKKLQEQLKVLVDSFHGTAGVYVYHLKKNREAAINADTVFPTASIVKIPIMVGLFDRLEKDSIQYYKDLFYRDSMKYGGSGLMQNFRDSA